MSDCLRPSGLLLCPWDSPGKNTGVGCHALLQGTFLTQGLNLCLLHCRWILYPEATGDALDNGYIILILKFISNPLISYFS